MTKKEYAQIMEKDFESGITSINAILSRPKGVAPSTVAICALAKAVLLLARVQLYK